MTFQPVGDVAARVVTAAVVGDCDKQAALDAALEDADARLMDAAESRGFTDGFSAGYRAASQRFGVHKLARPDLVLSEEQQAKWFARLAEEFDEAEQASECDADAFAVDLVAQRRRDVFLSAFLALPREQGLFMAMHIVDTFSEGLPDYLREDSDVVQDAQLWADFAAPHELRAIAAAVLKRVADMQPVMGERTRKALLVDLWSSLPPAWRMEFLRRVDPAGEFVAAKVGGGA